MLKKLIKDIEEQLPSMQEQDIYFVAGYLMGIREEREQQKNEKMTFSAGQVPASGWNKDR